MSKNVLVKVKPDRKFYAPDIESGGRRVSRVMPGSVVTVTQEVARALPDILEIVNRSPETAVTPTPKDPGTAGSNPPAPDDLPADFPYQKILAENGIVSLADLVLATDGELLAIDGIGPGRLSEIREAQGV